MNSAVSAYSRRVRNRVHTIVSSGYPLSGWAWWLVAFGSLVLVAGFGLSLSLTPDPRGFGTHQQFGLPPCTFRTLFGIPCPSCGGTTAFALFVRGRWIAAAQANPAVFLFALLCGVMLPWSWLSLWKRRLCGVHEPVTTLAWLMLTLSGVSLLHWSLRLL